MGDITTDNALAMSKLDLIERERQLTAIYIIRKMKTSKYYYCGLFDYDTFMKDIAKEYGVEGEDNL